MVAEGRDLLVSRWGADGALVADRVLSAGAAGWLGLTGLAAREGEVALALVINGVLHLDGVSIAAQGEVVLLVLDEAQAASGFVARIDPPVGEAAPLLGWVQTRSAAPAPDLLPLGGERVLVIYPVPGGNDFDERARADGALLHSTFYRLSDLRTNVGAGGEPTVAANFRSGVMRTGGIDLGPFDDAPNAVAFEPEPNGAVRWAQVVVADETVRAADWSNHPDRHAASLHSASQGGGRVWLFGTHYGNLWLRFTHELRVSSRPEEASRFLGVLRFTE